MVEDPSSWLREPARAMAPAAVLGMPLDMLQGVTADALVALDTIGIATILDLGAASLFALARQIVQAAEGEGPIGAAGPLPADMIDDAFRGVSAAEVARQPIEVLRLLDAPSAARLAAALPALSVRDLGLWPPSLAAMRLVNIAYGGTDRAADPEAPQELQPRMGRLPVDRLQYSALLFESLFHPRMLQAPGNPPGGDDTPFTRGRLRAEPDPTDDAPEFPLDLTDALLGKGYDQPGLGFVLTLQQSWYGAGLSLGHLLHSLALAPGEATRIAIVDWSRRVASETAEGISEDEALRAGIESNRSVTEITSAVSKEAQKGFSKFSMEGHSGGFGLGAAGNIKGVDVSFGASYAGVSAKGSVASSSQGERDVAGKMTQDAHDRTEQFASLSRSRRASVVSEVSVGEAERLSTRVVANYNHMHALSVLYFEIVQIYRVVTECVAVEPLLYLPVKPLNFKRTELVDRYRQLLASAALSAEARDALLGIVPKPSAMAPLAGGIIEMRFFNPSLTPEIVDGSGGNLRDSTLRAALGDVAATGPNLLRFDARHARLAEIQIGTVDASQLPIARTLSVARADGVTTLQFEKAGRPPKDPQKYLPEPGDSQTAFRVQLPVGLDRGTSAAVLELQDGWRWDESVAKAGQLGVWPRVRFILELLDPSTGEARGQSASFEVGPMAPAAAGTMRLAQLSLVPGPSAAAPPAAPPFDLVGHLQANALHYTMALLREADPALLGAMISGLSILGRPLMGGVDPVPVTTMGNYLVFRWPALRDWDGWQALCKERGLEAGRGRRIGAIRESLVPVASGGVFAEAVLGRFNSAEKLDLTRFWNWQDSPIPIPPPEIAALQAGGRQGAATDRPGTLGPASLQVRDAPTLPDPAGVLAKALDVAAKGDSFRDMSGVNALLTAGGTAATLAAQNAAKFMETAMQSVSAYGARINQARDMDKRAAEEAAQKDRAAAPAGGSAPSPQPSGGGGTPPGGSPAPGGSGGPGGAPARAPATPSSTGPGGNERDAFAGPKPDEMARKAEQPKPTMRSFELMIRITDRETLDHSDKTRPVAGPGTRRIDCDGGILLPALSPDQPGTALTAIANGVGSRRFGVPGARRSAALQGEFLVRRFDVVEDSVAELDTWRGVDGSRIPIAVSSELTRLNKVPVVGNLVALPDDAGTLTLDFHAVPYAARTIRTRLKSPGKKAEYERIVAPIEFNLAARLAGTSATPAEIASMEEQAAAYVGNAHARVRDFLEDTAWRPLLACNLLLDNHAGVLTLRFSFAAMAPLQLASATID